MNAINAQMGGATSGIDTSAPTIYSLGVSPASSSVAFNWSTTENASGIIYYSTAPLSMLEGSPISAIAIGGSSILANSDLRVSHSATLTGLNSNTTYYYVVYARDGSGNENITWPRTFSTSN